MSTHHLTLPIYKLGAFAEAEAAFTECAAIRGAALGAEHEDTAAAAKRGRAAAQGQATHRAPGRKAIGRQAALARGLLPPSGREGRPCPRSARRGRPVREPPTSTYPSAGTVTSLSAARLA